MEAEKTFFFLNQGFTEQMVEVAVYPGENPLAVLIIVGQGGSVDGYKNKYQIIASKLVEHYGANIFCRKAGDYRVHVEMQIIRCTD